jgi:hypothetical protein
LKESDNDYQKVICKLSKKFRVIDCRNGIQWILQKQDNDGRRWRSLNYHTHRSSLIRDAGKQDVGTTPLKSLPERHWSPSKAGCASKSAKDDLPHQPTLVGAAANRFLNAYRKGEVAPDDR